MLGSPSKRSDPLNTLWETFFKNRSEQKLVFSTLFPLHKSDLRERSGETWLALKP